MNIIIAYTLFGEMSLNWTRSNLSFISLRKKNQGIPPLEARRYVKRFVLKYVENVLRMNAQKASPSQVEKIDLYRYSLVNCSMTMF